MGTTGDADGPFWNDVSCIAGDGFPLICEWDHL